MYDDLCSFFYDKFNISKTQLKIIKYDLNQHYFSDLFKKHKNYEHAKTDDRCLEIQYMKFIWVSMEDMSYDYYYWIDAGLSHCGLIPEKHREPLPQDSYSIYFNSPLFNNTFLSNLNNLKNLKILGKENNRFFWSQTVPNKYYNNYDNSYHIIGGLFGGKKELWKTFLLLFKLYTYNVSITEQHIYHEELILSLMYQNHKQLFYMLPFDIWNPCDSINKKKTFFYDILTNLN